MPKQFYEIDTCRVLFKKWFTFVTKQVILMRSSTVLSLSLQLVFVALTFSQMTFHQRTISPTYYVSYNCYMLYSAMIKLLVNNAGENTLCSSLYGT
jgi:hypothetical protein